jgi:hypothetical protein
MPIVPKISMEAVNIISDRRLSFLFMAESVT